MASMSLQAAFDQARQWLESNDLNRAIGLAQYILEHYPENLDAYRILGEAYLANRQLDRAQDAFERVLRADPENIPAHVGLGITFERQGRLDRAIPEFEQALEIKPDMPELRSQLLRLYTDAWGSEHAHLRLSRAGLARLYAKGHMLPQAINEFRQVVAEQPDRFDAQVAMAEALWRDGQEDAAIDLCRSILAKRPESLKANLILGYLEMAGGQPEGERAWEAARNMDPYQVVARAVFDTLPPDSGDEPMIEEWDEDAWRKRQAEEQERIAATRPMEAVTPVAIPVPADSSGNGSRYVPPPPPPPTPRAAPAANPDDFLANLLAINSAPPPAPAPSSSEEDLDLDLDMAPFSLDDLEGPPAATSAAQQPTSALAGTPPAEEELTTTPFSLTDLGLSDDEIAGLESLNDSPVAEAEAQEDVSAITPFSLTDLGLSDDEIAGLESLNDSPAAEIFAEPPAVEASPVAAPDDDEPVMTPFSLSDLGLSDEEVAGLESATADAPAAAQPEADEPTLSPFSLSDLGLSEDEIAGLDSLDLESGGAPVRGEPPLTAPQSSQADPDELDTSDLPLDLQPFSLDELDLNSGSAGPSISGLGSSLQPFTFDEPPPQRPRVSGFVADEGFDTSPDEPESAPDTGGFSWQQPTQKPQPGFLKSMRSEPEPAEGSIFSKLKQRHVDEGHAERVPEPLPPMPIGADEHLGLFSMDNVSLRDDEEHAPAAEAAPIASAPAEPEPTPEQSHAGHTHAEPLDVENLQEAIETGQVQPFSFADLGLSEEEIAAFGLAGAATAASIASHESVEPTAPIEPAASVEPPTPEPSAGRGALYTLDDLDPVESEALESAPTTPTSKVEGDEGLPGTGDLQPFSLTDLGLSDDEIASLGLDAAEPEMSVGSELGITEEDLEGLGIGNLSWDQPPTAPASPASAEAPPAEEPMQTTSGDLLVDRLIALGHQQGYVDISDIIAAFEDPEAEAERIEQIGQRLHEARIEIRDGDEVIDMDAEYAEEGEVPSAQIEEQPDDLPATPPREDEVPMTPFSLTDLGLSEDEIAALGLGESAEPSAPEPVSTPEEEPSMSPFSLTDLGLSEDEIAALGLGEPQVASEPVAATPEPALEDEPVMTPFSLTDLGLSEDEIAGLGLGEPEAAVPAPEGGSATATDASAVTPEAEPESIAAPEAESEEPVMTPFSLTDLGLSDAEIAALGLGAGAAAISAPEPASEQAEPEEPAMTPFSLTELGLTEEEIAGLDAAESAAAPADAEQAAPEPEPEPEPEPVAPPTPEPVATAPAAPPARPATGRAADAPPSSTGSELLDSFMRRLEADPQNHMLRLSVARAGGQLGNPDFSIQQYRYLIKNNALLDMVVDDLQDLIADADERQLQKRLHRTLGDVYTRQGRLEEAMDEYSWTPAGS